ncbi:MAG: hypothetical protein AM326_10405 [Candidatus Thorarchaeota archaeon SMTZ-45]|nr:MAG: hypothetical protein AM325_09040 [Candidatus Thorarchaeota archaeon SMTZ1-45]KXH73749.1 MAG: hypothetical protein AM326_10405 [Candidatus Thorarchaeota archaeon SMTZ-45]
MKDGVYEIECVRKHNSLDKVNGLGILNDYVLSQSLALLSSQLVSKIVSKYIDSRIIMIASMTVAIDNGTKLARNTNMTIVGSLSNERS